MARVALQKRDQLPEHLRALWDRMTTYGPFEGQAAAMANRLPVFEHMWRLLTQLADEGVLPKRYLELAIVAVSLVNQCDFCVAQHTPKLAVEGITTEGAANLLDWEKHPANTRSRSPATGIESATRCSSACARISTTRRSSN